MSKKLEEEFGLKPIKPHKYFTGNQWTKRSFMEWKANENKKAKSSRKSDVKKSSVQTTNNSQQEKNE
tara:strand:+ start:762 stop:962 length:201 start_codon:yes stop_codon:yes gene_type:complete